MIGLVAAVSLAIPQVEIPQLPPITRDPQVTFLDRSGTVIGVRGGRYAPPVDIAKRRVARRDKLSSSIEDKRFYEHSGYDLAGMAGAVR